MGDTLAPRTDRGGGAPLAFTRLETGVEVTPGSSKRELEESAQSLPFSLPGTRAAMFPAGVAQRGPGVRAGLRGAGTRTTSGPQTERSLCELIREGRRSEQPAEPLEVPALARVRRYPSPFPSLGLWLLFNNEAERDSLSTG